MTIRIQRSEMTETYLVDDGQDEDEWRFGICRLLGGHDSEVKSVSWSCSGTLLATCSRESAMSPYGFGECQERM
jgi:hypothetical protein